YVFFNLSDIDFGAFQMRQAGTNLAEATVADDADLHAGLDFAFSKDRACRCDARVVRGGRLFKRTTFWHGDELFWVDFSFGFPATVHSVTEGTDHRPNGYFVTNLPVGDTLSDFGDHTGSFMPRYDRHFFHEAHPAFV